LQVLLKPIDGASVKVRSARNIRYEEVLSGTPLHEAPYLFHLSIDCIQHPFASIGTSWRLTGKLHLVNCDCLIFTVSIPQQSISPTLGLTDGQADNTGILLYKQSLTELLEPFGTKIL
jgi:hypothetical protein